MHNQTKSRFLFYMLTLSLCLNSFFLTTTAAQVTITPVAAPADSDYTFERIEVEGVDFLALTASSDFGDYAGYTKSTDGQKDIAFTLIDDVFTTYDFPGSENTYFYALGNNGNAAGYYEDREGAHHGVVLENGELRQYDFPGSIETEIYGISDATGAMTGNIVGADGVRRGFTGERIVEIPGATATYADFINSSGRLMGTYTDADGIFHRYSEPGDGTFLSFDISNAENLEFVFVHGVTDAWVVVYRSKAVGDVPRSYVGRYTDGLKELRVPGSVSTEGWNINQDTSVVGYYDTADGKRHGFVANPIESDGPPTFASTTFNYIFEKIDVEGVDFLAATASSDFGDYAGYTKSADGQKDIAFTLIDDVFATYDFPGARNTYFYALGNNGNAAGYYEDSNGLHQGVVLENGELRQYNFPDSVQTEIWGISDTTGALTGNFIGIDGIRRGFSGEDTIVEVSGALATYSDFVSPNGGMVGSFIDADGVYHPYLRSTQGNFVPFNLPDAESVEYYFVHGSTDGRVHVIRFKRVGDVPRTHVGTFAAGQQHEVQFPGSVRTEGYNINADLSVVGHYETSNGRIHSFIARLAADTDEPTGTEPVAAPDDSNYTFERIDVKGVDYLALTASSEFEDYAGYTPSPDGEKMVGFTIIDGVFKIHDFPGSQNTFFYALGNDGRAAGYYEDSNGLHHGIILENGELRQYDFPDAIQTEIYGISDATGALTGNFIDAAGVRRGFTGDEIIAFPGASETFAYFVAAGRLVSSYIDADGIYHAYVRDTDGGYRSIDLPQADSLEYIFFYGINSAGIYVARSKRMGDIPRTYVGTFRERQELQFPGAVRTGGWNINEDGSVVGHYESPDGRIHGFIARPAAETVVEPIVFNYTFESIDVPGVEFLQLAASSDFEDYAGNTRSPDGEKIVGFTLIDGVFKTYDFPSSQGTFFHALGNNGNAAGYYVDSDGHHRGVVLENGELRPYDYPGSVETEIWGISDATGALTGNYIDASGVRRGFSGDAIIEYPGAVETYADFVAAGRLVGSYIDAEGIYHAYIGADGKFTSIDLAGAENMEYFFFHGINDAGISVGRAKEVGDVPRTYVGSFRGWFELQFPGSVSTEGYNINQDGSVVGNYVSPDGRTHGFIARPADEAVSNYFSNTYTVTLAKGLNMISVPLAPPKPMNARSLAGLTGATTVITLDTATQRFVGWTPDAPDDGFPVEGGQGYIVNVPQPRNFAFVGAPWTTQTEDAAAAPAASSTEMAQEAWAFVVSGHLEGQPAFDGYQVIVHNLRTNSTITAPVQGDYFAAANADLSRRSVIQVGDVLQVHVIGPDGNVESDTRSYKVTPEDLSNAVLSIRLDNIGKPKLTRLLQNFPNPFNPETWIPYQLETSAEVTLQIYDTAGSIVRTLELGFKAQGFYMTRTTAAYWDGRNNMGEQVASGVYFYSLQTPDFSATRKMLILK